jgi:hypothetical protein
MVTASGDADAGRLIWLAGLKIAFTRIPVGWPGGLL